MSCSADSLWITWLPQPLDLRSSAARSRTSRETGRGSSRRRRGTGGRRARPPPRTAAAPRRRRPAPVVQRAERDGEENRDAETGAHDDPALRALERVEGTRRRRARRDEPRTAKRTVRFLGTAAGECSGRLRTLRLGRVTPTRPFRPVSVPTGGRRRGRGVHPQVPGPLRVVQPRQEAEPELRHHAPRRDVLLDRDRDDSREPEVAETPTPRTPRPPPSRSRGPTMRVERVPDLGVVRPGAVERRPRAADRVPRLSAHSTARRPKPCSSQWPFHRASASAALERWAEVAHEPGSRRASGRWSPRPRDGTGAGAAAPSGAGS